MNSVMFHMCEGGTTLQQPSEGDTAANRKGPASGKGHMTNGRGPDWTASWGMRGLKEESAWRLTLTVIQIFLVLTSTIYFLVVCNKLTDSWRYPAKAEHQQLKTECLSQNLA